MELITIIAYVLIVIGGFDCLSSIFSSITHYAADERNTVKWGRRIQFVFGLVNVICGLLLLLQDIAIIIQVV